MLDEKAAATQALGLFALHTKSSYAPYPLSWFFVLLFLNSRGTLLSSITILGSLTILSYLEETLKILVRHSGYFHEDVRLQAIISLERELLALLSLQLFCSHWIAAFFQVILYGW